MRIDLSGVGHRFGASEWLFLDLSYTLLKDRIYALTGPSGSGKSTLLSIIAGHTEPTRGRVARTEVDRVTWVFQHPHGDPHRTIVDLVSLPLLAFGQSRKEARSASMAYLDEVGLGGQGDATLSTLSGGQAQRVMLARALATRPNLLLVDEPTAQLDSETAKTVIGSLADLAHKGVIVVVATHDVRTRDACTDTIDLGQIRAKPSR